MSSSETKHQEWIKQVLDESDKEYQAELERQNEIEAMISEGSPLLITDSGQQEGLKKS